MTDLRDRITYISAGAGSGKTYTLTHILADKLQNDVDPSQVIVTTFTRKAAAELKEKSRAVLYEKGLYDKATQMDLAVIGTVDSVAELFVRKYWYLLGLNAQLNVMDENDVTTYINSSLSEMSIDKDFRDALETFVQYGEDFGLSYYDFNEKKMVVSDFWKNDLKKIIESAIRNEISDFAESEKQSIAFLDSIIGKRNELEFPPEQVKADCKYFTDGLKEKKYQKLNEYCGGDTISIKNLNEILKVIQSVPENKYSKVSDITQYVAKYEGLWSSVFVYDKIVKVIQLEFQLAKEWKDRYAAFKREHSLIDFSDMESYFLQLLNRPEIVEEIQGRYKCVFVDEFQDCNPIQVKIFSRLAELVEHSTWVGDAKQAIYAFRGTDTALTDAIANNFGSEDATLKDSHRSLPNLVNLSNHFFTNVFKDRFSLFGDERKIILNPLRPKAEDGEDPSLEGTLEAWVMPTKSYVQNIARNIAKLIGDGEKAKDIAVLTRGNAEAGNIAEALIHLGIAVNSSSMTKLIECKETCLLLSILSLIIDKNDNLSKSQIAYLTEPGSKAAAIIDSRIESVKRGDGEWKADNPIIKKIDDERSFLSHLPITALVQTIITRFQLFNYVSYWGNADVRKANLEMLVTAASQYEAHCQMMTIGSSISGFIQYINSIDIPGAGNSDGVFVDTYHKAKGLEWPTVILCSFAADNEMKMLKNTYFTVATETNGQYDDMAQLTSVIRYVPQIVAAGKTNLPDSIATRLRGREDHQQRIDKEICEEARLMYVGFTRAKDKLILALADHIEKLQSMVTGINVTLPTEGITQSNILGTDDIFNISFYEEITENDVPVQDNGKCRIVEIATGSVQTDSLMPRYVAPSSLKTERTAVSQKGIIENHINKNARYDIDLVGNCIHNIFCVLRQGSGDNLAIVSDLLKQNNMTEFRAKEIVDTYESFCKFLKDKYGASQATYHELPFFYNAEGQTVRGSMDFVYETSSGCVLVDFKTNDVNPTNVLNDVNQPYYAGHFAGQFHAYAQALTMAGKQVIERLIFYPLTGLIVHID